MLCGYTTLSSQVGTIITPNIQKIKLRGRIICPILKASEVPNSGSLTREFMVWTTVLGPPLTLFLFADKVTGLQRSCLLPRTHSCYLGGKHRFLWFVIQGT